MKAKENITTVETPKVCACADTELTITYKGEKLIAMDELNLWMGIIGEEKFVFAIIVDTKLKTISIPAKSTIDEAHQLMHRIVCSEHLTTEQRVYLTNLIFNTLKG